MNPSSPSLLCSGVILSGSAYLFELTRNDTYLEFAFNLAQNTLKTLVYGDGDGTLREPCEPNGNCGKDGRQFKGAFIRHWWYFWQIYSRSHRHCHHHLHHSDLVHQSNAMALHVMEMAETLWHKARNELNEFGTKWNAKPSSQKHTGPIRQAAATDLLVVNAALHHRDGAAGTSGLHGAS